jgi:hypothetical protein
MPFSGMQITLWSLAVCALGYDRHKAVNKHIRTYQKLRKTVTFLGHKVLAGREDIFI